MQKRQLRFEYVFFYLLFICIIVVTGSAQATFTHPGVFHTQADLNRIRDKVAANEQPWLDGYTALAADSHSSYNYSMQGPYSYISRLPHAYLSQWENDCGAVYQNAIMWYITGDQRHANKAIEILDGWSDTCTAIYGADARLTAGLQGHKFITAAEIIRYADGGSAGWSQAGIDSCSNFVENVLLPLNRMSGGGNWGIIGAISAMSAGIFLDDEDVFNEAVNVLKYGAPTECDAGIVNYIDVLGWTTEADRDIGHWALGLNNLGAGAHIAWCQGVDLWSYLDFRILRAHEYLAEYNLGNSVAYTPVDQCDGMRNGSLTTDGLGRWDIYFWEQAYHPYQNMLGVAAPFTEQAVAETRSEAGGADGYDRDHIGFGTLVFALEPRDANLSVVPTGLQAVATNGQVSLSWNVADGANSYNVKRSRFREGPYSTLAANVTVTNYIDSTPINGTRYYYCVSAVNNTGETVNSALASTYPSGGVPAAPADVTASVITQTRIDITWASSLGATSYNVKRAVAIGGPYTTIVSGLNGPFLSYADEGLSPDRTYYYVVTANNHIGESADSLPSSDTTLSLLPEGWSFADAGYQTTPGNATYSDGVFTVQGAGLDYGGSNVDSFGFAYWNVTGDGEIVARFAGRQNYSQIGKIGLAMRESLDGGSKHIFAMIDGSDNAYCIYRSSTGAGGTASGTTTVSDSTLPQWLKVTRSGNTFIASVSSNGTTWAPLNSVSLSMNNTLLVGLVVCSRNNGCLDTATFDYVTVTGWDGPPIYCGDYGTVYLESDLNQDCYVNIKDFAILASEWLSGSN